VFLLEADVFLGGFSFFLCHDVECSRVGLTVRRF
jgi:hypothetical protein